jgi:hypothetical protein
VQIAERWIIVRLRKERFMLLGALYERIDEMVEVIINRPFKKLEESRDSVFIEIEEPALQPLPTTRYDFALWTKAKVSLDYHLQIDRNFCSVPYGLVVSVLDVRTSANVVGIFAMSRRVASRKRSYAKGVAVTEAPQKPSSHRRHARWTPSRIVDWVRKTGPSTAQFIEALLACRPHHEQGFRSALAVLRLEKRYGPERLEPPVLARSRSNPLLQVRVVDPATRSRPAPPHPSADAFETDTLQHPRCELLLMKDETC